MVLLFIFAFIQIALMGLFITWDVVHPRLIAKNGEVEKQTQKAGATFAAVLPQSDWSVSRG